MTIRSGHGVGKTRLESWEAWRHLICYKTPSVPLKIPCTGPTGGNLDDILWSEMAVVKGHLLPFLSDRFTINADGIYCIESPRDWFASPRTARRENPNALQGFHGTPLYVIDEGAEVVDEVYEVAEGAMTDEGARAIMCGNPTRLDGYFYRAHNSPDSKWASMRISCEDSLTTELKSYPYYTPTGERVILEAPGRVTPEYIENMEREYGRESAVFAYRVLGDFPTSESDQLIRTGWVDRAMKREDPGDDESLLVMGVDVGWTGDDSSLVLRQGRRILEAESWHGLDPTQTFKKIEDRCKDLNDAGTPVRWICVDAIGMGAGVFSNLYRAGQPALKIQTQESSPEDAGTKCRRLRDWLWWQTRTFFRDDNPVFIDKSKAMTRLSQELCQPGFTEENGAIVVESKKSMKKRGLKSPDLADALCNTFFVNSSPRPEKKRRPLRRPHREQRRSKEPSRWKIL